MLPEDGRRPKHVAAFKYFIVCFLNTENISAFVGFSWKILLSILILHVKFDTCCKFRHIYNVRIFSGTFGYKSIRSVCLWHEKSGRDYLWRPVQKVSGEGEEYDVNLSKYRLSHARLMNLIEEWNLQTSYHT
jgi:hypothetical protein